MNKFELSFNVDNEAFQGGGMANEIRDILEEIGAKVVDGFEFGPILDINGNVIGSWRIGK